MTAFNRLSEADKASFLAENPDSWLNPNRPGRLRQNVYTDRPPAPPGTMAYAQWYWTHLMRSQPLQAAWSQQQQQPGGGYPAYGPVPPYAGMSMGAGGPQMTQRPLPSLPYGADPYQQMSGRKYG